MRYDRCQIKFDIYVNNPSVCKMIIMKDRKDDEKIIGRALLWETNKGKFMDRVYSLEHNNMYDFYQYAEENNYIYTDVYGRYKKNNRYITPPELIVNLYKKNKNIIYKFIDLFKRKKDFDINQYPYFDTLKYFNYKDYSLSNKLSSKYVVLLDEL